MALAEDLRTILARVKRRGMTEEEHAAFARLRELGRGAPLLAYLAWSGDYPEERRLEAAFTSQVDAEALELSDDVEEIVVQAGPAEVRDWHGVIWYLGRPLRTPEETPPLSVPNPYPSSGGPQRHIYDGWPKRLEVSKGMPNSIGYGTLWVSGWDLELVMAEGNRIYREETS